MDVSAEGRKQWMRCVASGATIRVRVQNVVLNAVQDGMSQEEKFGAWSWGAEEGK